MKGAQKRAQSPALPFNLRVRPQVPGILGAVTFRNAGRTVLILITMRKLIRV